jgi:hypothetical protein
MSGGRKTWKLHLIVFTGYVLLVVLLTWPTASHLTTHFPGDGGDDPAIAWNLWWIKYSLLNEPQNPFFCNFMFYPVGINLAFYTLTTLNGLTTLPLLLNLGVVTTSNLHLWFSFALGGYGTFLLARYVLSGSPWGLSSDDQVTRWAAILAGMVYAFASSKLFYAALGQFNIASTHWIPFSVLFYIKMHYHPRNLRWPALSALFLVLQAWTEMTYASFLLVFMGLYWLYWLIADRRRQVIRLPYLKAATLLAFLFMVGLGPILAAMLPDMQTEGDFFVVGGGFADAFSADLAGFFVPTMHHPLFGHLIEQTNIANFSKGQHIYLGYTLLLLVGLGFQAHRQDATARFWLLASLVFALLCLGPKIAFNGHNTPIPGPFVVLQSLPFFKGNRYPSRYSVMFLLSMAPLAALGIKRLYGGARKQGIRRAISPPLLSLLIVLFFLFEHLSIPLPQFDTTVPEPYQLIAQSEGDFAVLDIPFAWRNGFRITGAYTTGFMSGQFYQTKHQKRMLQGNTSRNPEFKFQYFTEAPVLSSLRILETGHELPSETWQADARYAADVLRFFNIKYIIVRPEEAGYLNNPQATIPYLEDILPVEKLHQEPTLSLYRVVLPALPNQVKLLTGSPLTPLYFAEGWGIPGDAVVAHRKEARLLVPMNGQAQEARFMVRFWENSRLLSEIMWLEMNGWRSKPVQLTQTWQELTIDLPAEAVTAGLNDIRLHFDNSTEIKTNGIELTVLSAGEEAGNFGHIYLNGIEISPNQRGYNIAVIAPDGRLINAASFDTHLDPNASRALAQFIAAAPPEALIAVAAADEASNMLTEEAVAALHAIGGQVDPRGHFRASHALIGGKGGQPLFEAFDPYQPVKLTNGAGLVESRVTAIFEEIVFEAKE